MSHMPLSPDSSGRGLPRWSTVGQPFAAVPPWSIAGLPARSACVAVGPPLLPSRPSPASAPVMSVGSENPHVVPLSRLYPEPSPIDPVQFAAAVLPATIVPSKVTVPPRLVMPSELAAIVE